MIAGGSDFLLPTDLILVVGTKGDSITNITVDILDDLNVEGTECFNISGFVTSKCSLQVVVDTSAVTIIDDDCKWGYVNKVIRYTQGYC